MASCHVSPRVRAPCLHADRHRRHRRRGDRYRPCAADLGRRLRPDAAAIPDADDVRRRLSFLPRDVRQRSPGKAGVEHRLSRRRLQLQRPPRGIDQGPRDDGPRGRRAVPGCRRRPPDRRRAVPVSVHLHGGCRDGALHRDRSGAAARLSAQGRLPPGLGLPRHWATGAVRPGDRQDPAAGTVPDRRSDAARSPDVADDVPGDPPAADGLDQRPGGAPAATRWNAGTSMEPLQTRAVSPTRTAA